MAIAQFYFDILTGEEFEDYLKALFKNLGYEVEKTPKTGDYGADLIIYKNGKKTVVQAKRYNSPIGVSAIQEAIGATSYYHATNGMVVTNHYFTPNAIKLAGSANIELWDKDALIKKIIYSLGTKNDSTIHAPQTDDAFQADNNTQFLEDYIENEIYAETSYRLPVILGKDSSNGFLMDDINNIHHLLIKGTINSGKSNFLHCIILSLLYKNIDDSIKLLLIDIDGLELNIYRGLDSLLIPVVTNVAKALGAFNWIAAEISQRYNVFVEACVKNLNDCNQYLIGKNKPIIPEIIIVIDEIADIYHAYKQELANSVSHIIERGSQVGIHLIIATRNNACAKLLGNICPSTAQLLIDKKQYIMTLKLPYQEKELNSVHRPYISQEGALDMIDAINRLKRETYMQRISKYEKELLNTILDIESNTDLNLNIDIGSDEFLEDAVKFVMTQEKVSIPLLQRKFKMERNKASRLLKILETNKVVGAIDEGQTRRVLVSAAQWEKYKDAHSKASVKLSQKENRSFFYKMKTKFKEYF